MKQDELMLKVENVSKIYKLGEIGGTTLRDELQRLSAKLRKKEDPTKRIGTKNYNKGEKFKALDDISFEVKKGERVGIIGHNGAGKSTLLKLISRVTGPTAGKIYLNGRVASMLEVGTGFHPELTGRENVYMNGAILGMTKKEIDAKMEDIIEFSEVRQFIDTPVKRYSSGMYVKLAFSVAAHLDSEIMIMDEVLAVGDMAFQNKCLTKMKEVSTNEERTILYVSHNMNTIRQLCDKVIVLNHGKIVFNGDVEDGINLYLNNGMQYSETFFDVENLERPNGINGKLLFQSIEYINMKTNTVIRGETVRIRVKWHCVESIKDYFLRISFRNSADNVIGTLLSEPLFECVKGNDYSAEFSIKTDLFAKSRFVLGFAFLQRDEGGNSIAIDLLRRVSALYVNETSKNTDFFNTWSEQNWGSLHFPSNKIKWEHTKIE